jgi:hypothetical protein
MAQAFTMARLHIHQNALLFAKYAQKVDLTPMTLPKALVIHGPSLG